MGRFRNLSRLQPKRTPFIESQHPDSSSSVQRVQRMLPSPHVVPTSVFPQALFPFIAPPFGPPPPPPPTPPHLISPLSSLPVAIWLARPPLSTALPLIPALPPPPPPPPPIQLPITTTSNGVHWMIARHQEEMKLNGPIQVSQSMANVSRTRSNGNITKREHILVQEEKSARQELDRVSDKLADAERKFKSEKAAWEILLAHKNQLLKTQKEEAEKKHSDLKNQIVQLQQTQLEKETGGKTLKHKLEEYSGEEPEPKRQRRERRREGSKSEMVQVPRWIYEQMHNDLARKQQLDKLEGVLERLRENVTCIVCKEVALLPVLLGCCHFMCQHCLGQQDKVIEQANAQESKQSRLCPLCRKEIIGMGFPVHNLRKLGRLVYNIDHGLGMDAGLDGTDAYAPTTFERQFLHARSLFDHTQKLFAEVGFYVIRMNVDTRWWEEGVYFFFHPDIKQAYLIRFRELLLNHYHVEPVKPCVYAVQKRNVLNGQTPQKTTVLIRFNADGKFAAHAMRVPFAFFHSNSSQAIDLEKDVCNEWLVWPLSYPITGSRENPTLEK